MAHLIYKSVLFGENILIFDNLITKKMNLSFGVKKIFPNM